MLGGDFETQGLQVIGDQAAKLAIVINHQNRHTASKG
jgi:hypothetical protein